MRPRKLIMSAFCPYPAQAEVDFERLGPGGLFLITGETGAGKTTVFDGISFALYGEVSGENRGVDTLRSDFALPAVPTFVQLWFEHKGAVYEVRRNPRYLRPSKRGGAEKSILQGADATLLFPDGRIVTGAAAVSEEITALLGIHHKQFKQISMIAQGEFLKLLLADSKERAVIFRRVFSTQLYERLQAELKSKSLSLKNALEEVQASISQYRQGTLCPGDHPLYLEFLRLREEPYALEEFLSLTEALIDAAAVDKSGIEAHEKELLGQMQAQTALVALMEANNATLARLAATRDQLAALEDRVQEISALEARMALGKRALYHVSPLWNEAQKARERLEQLQARQAENNALIAQSLPLREAALAALQSAKEDEPMRDGLTAQISALEQSLPQYARLTQLRAELSRAKLEMQTAQAAEAALRKRMGEQRMLLSATLGEAALLAGAQAEQTGAAADEGDALRQLQSLSALEEQSRLRAELAARLGILQAAFEEENSRYAAASRQYLQLEYHFLAEQAGLLAASLQEGVPCPVCGSPEHPKPARLSKDAPTQTELTEKKELLEQLQSSRQQKSDMARECKVRLESADARLEEGALALGVSNRPSPQEINAEIARRMGEAKERLSRAKERLAKARGASERKQALDGQAEELRLSLEQNEAELLEAQQKLSAQKVRCAAAESGLASLEAGLEFSDEARAKESIEKKKAQLAAEKARLADALENHQQISSRIALAQKLAEDMALRLTGEQAAVFSAREKLDAALSEQGFSSPGDYAAALLQETELQRLSEEVTGFHTLRERALAALAELERSASGLRASDPAGAKDALAALEKELEAAGAKRSEAEHLLQTNTRLLEKLREKQEKCKELETLYAQARLLSDTANGELSGKQKLPFEQYVQGVYFDMVLAEANLRLGKMTGSRYRLIRRTEAANLRSTTGLELDVADAWTGKSRSVKSLSGGEAFKASLSMALGLSDVAQRFAGGIELDTLFIDEGFGSLDSESLEQAMELLGELGGSSRLVGIISHVEELKEKIDKKLVIRKDRQGSRIEMEL